MTVRAVTDAEINYYCKRQPYLRQAINFAEQWNPETVLELGAAFLKLFIREDTMGLDNNFFEPTYFHDATVVPWPIADKQYDVFIATQVWEHLEGRQQQAFAEAQRVARHGVFSFPLEWSRCPVDSVHYMITREKIAEWTLHLAPVNSVLIRGKLVLAFDFGD